MRDIQIRRFRETDLNDLFLLLSDAEVMRYLEPPFTRGQTEAFLKTQGLGESPRIYAVDLDRSFAGYVIYHAYDEESMEIGWILRKELWHKGIADALTEQLAALAAAEGKDAVIECVPDQAASRHIAWKHGFVQCGEADGLVILVRKNR